MTTMIINMKSSSLEAYQAISKVQTENGITREGTIYKYVMEPTNKGVIPRTFRAALAVATECTGKVDDIDYKCDKWTLTHTYRIMLDSQMAHLTRMNLNRLL